MPLTQEQKQFIARNYQRVTVPKLAKQLEIPEAEVRTHVAVLKKMHNRRRQRLFSIAALSIPVLFFVLLEIGLRIGDYGGNMALFLSAPGEYHDYYMCNPHVGKRYFFMQHTIPDPPNDLFLKKKPANGYRIFALGGSTTAGYPYGNNIMFPRILQKRLADTFPDKEIEVINTAMTAINTYTLLDYMDEIIAKQADAIIIYAGHNEFYGALGAGSAESLGKFRGFVKFYLKLERFKTFILLRNWIGAAKKWIARKLFKGDVSDPSATLMERMVAEQTIPYGSPLYRLGREQFRNNLRDIVEKAQAAGLKVMLSELVSNIHSLPPFVSVAADTFPPAKEVFRQARALEAEGKFAAAKRSYYRAKDLDALRFRATEDFNRVVHEVAEEFRVPVVPMEAYFEAQSPHGFVGENLMLEHLHPNVDGYFLMADAFYDTMRREKFIAAQWDSTRIRPSKFYRDNWGFTDLDRAFCDLRIRILKGGWPFKPKSVPNRMLYGYRPSTLIDSLAWEAWKNESLNLERAHVKLAKRYEKAGEYRKAFEEYRSLIYETPWNSSPYLYAADMLIKARRLKRAIPFLKQSLKYEDSAFANKWLGQIYLDAGFVQKALPYLEKAVQMAPGDAQLVYNLSGGYALNQQYAQAMATLDKLAKIKPDFPGAADLRRQLTKILKKE